MPGTDRRRQAHRLGARRNSGTSRMHRGLLAVLVLALSPRPIVGQEPAVPYRVTWLDAVSVGTAGALYVLPAALGLPNGAPSCAPCDPASLPGAAFGSAVGWLVPTIHPTQP